MELARDRPMGQHSRDANDVSASHSCSKHIGSEHAPSSHSNGHGGTGAQEPQQGLGSRQGAAEVLSEQECMVKDTQTLQAQPSSSSLIMGLACTDGRPHYGVQFHPESIATRYGNKLLSNFARLAAAHQGLTYSTNP